MRVGVSKKEIIVAVCLFAVALVPRVTDLGAFLTADEKNWIGRSYEFVRAGKDWRFNDMLQTSHPGVTTLWLAGIAVVARMLLTHVPFTFEHLGHFVAAAQWPVALLNTLAIPAVYLLLCRILAATKSLQPAADLVPVLAALLIALDPWLVGYSRVVHVDALLASFLFTAALALLLYVARGYARRWLLLSALLSGGALLTKAPAIFIVPFFWLAVLLRERAALLHWTVFKTRSRDFVLWLLVAGLVFVLLWPAVLWVPNPEGNVLVLKRDLANAVITPHHMAEDYRLDGSFYLKTIITRITPTVLVLVISAGIWLGWLVVRRRHEINAHDPLLLLFAYAGFFGLMMTLGAKKGDRYLLPIAPAMDVLAAAGLWFAVLGGAAMVRRRRWVGFRSVRLAFAAASLVVVAVSGVTGWRYHPYAIAYSNPLWPDNLSQELGWGEGLEQVGAWLDAEVPNATVAAWYPEELGAFTNARVLHINAHEQPPVRYIVLYRNMFGRAPDHPANDYLDQYYREGEAVFTATVAGKEFAWVFAKDAYERVAGELVPGMRVGQEIATPGGQVQKLAVWVATYNGRATAGELVVQLKESLGGTIIQEWRIAAGRLHDNQWVEFTLPEPRLRATAFVEVFALGTQAGNAPTIRYSSDYDYRSSTMMLRSSGELGVSDAKPGDLAIRVQ
ncbi:MAG: hypothetical protein HY372_02195 [Candidatus Andersenbacteria bacterium]|nr:hypothetical protein [Candidatus Andersenbacteria bacterium]